MIKKWEIFIKYERKRRGIICRAFEICPLDKSKHIRKLLYTYFCCILTVIHLKKVNSKMFLNGFFFNLHAILLYPIAK